jgi:hypothetical protein
VLGEQRAVVAFNASDEPHDVSVAADGAYRAAYPAGGQVSAVDGALSIRLPARSATVWVRDF